MDASSLRPRCVRSVTSASTAAVKYVSVRVASRPHHQGSPAAVQGPDGEVSLYATKLGQQACDTLGVADRVTAADDDDDFADPDAGIFLNLLRQLVGACGEHRRGNHRRRYGQEDSDGRDLHYLDSGLSTLSDCPTRHAYRGAGGPAAGADTDRRRVFVGRAACSSNASIASST